MTSEISSTRVASAYTINALGTWFGVVALTIAVYHHTHSSLATAAFFLVSAGLPSFFVPVVVARIETVSGHGALSGVYLVEAGLCLALIVVLSHFSLWTVLVLGGLDGLASLTARALTRAAAAQFGRGEAREGEEAILGARRATALMNTGFSLTLVAGPPLAGLLVGVAGSRGALVVDVVSFLVCAALLVRVRVSSGGGADSVRSRLMEGARFLHGERRLRLLLCAQAVGLLGFLAVVPVDVLYIKSTLHGSDLDYGLFIAAWGIGQLAGNLLYARRLGGALHPMLIAGTVTMSVAYFSFGLAPTFSVACVIALAGGAGNGVQMSALMSTFQELAPPEMQARLMAVIESIGAGASVLAFSLGGAVAAIASPRVALMTAGVIGAVATVIFLYALLPQARSAALGVAAD